MTEIKREIYTYIEDADQFLGFRSFSGKSLTEWCRPLVESLTRDGAVPYLLESSRERYRASPLASVLISMNAANLLPDSAVDIMQNELLFLRDGALADDVHKGTVQKKPEDEAGWSLAEGVSVWSTSLAIIALLENNSIGIKKSDKYKLSVLWLADQKEAGKQGWGYQCWSNCEQNALMTALALRALVLSYKEKKYFEFSEDEEKKIINSISGGIEFLKRELVIKRRYACWHFKGKPHCAATIWALLALKEYVSTDIGKETESFYRNHLKKGLCFILDKMPKKSKKWESEQIVCEAGAKYSKQKNYYSFSATLLLELFSLGVSPYHPKVVNQIRWLVHHVDEWKIDEYDKADKCSFTYAMLLSVVARWDMLVGKENAKILTAFSDNFLERLIEKIYGMPLMKGYCYQIIYKPQAVVNLVFIIVLMAGLTNLSSLWGVIKSTAAWFWDIIGNSQNDLIVGIIASVMATAIISIVMGAYHFARERIGRYGI